MEPRGARFRARRAVADPAAAVSDGPSVAEPAGSQAGGDRDPRAHVALFYSALRDYAAAVGSFVRAGMSGGEAVMVAVPTAQANALRDHLGTDAAHVAFMDMVSLGRNPARIIPAIRAFADARPGQLVRYVGEPSWRSRSAAEQAEVLRHEALLNLAFGQSDVRILCPYDEAALDHGVLAGAERTHRALMRNGTWEPSQSYLDDASPHRSDTPLPEPPPGLRVLTYRDDPAAARAFAREQARAAGLREPRLTDLVIAVGELAANTLRHTTGSGTVRVWASASEVICEVRDGGHIRDPLAGRRFPAADAGRGHGLWVVNQVCDLVEMRTGTAGTTFRLHIALGD
jgi:anti-sigma regulatory factor (Ser/Thr protein kinase)